MDMAAGEVIVGKRKRVLPRKESGIERSVRRSETNALQRSFLRRQSPLRLSKCKRGFKMIDGQMAPNWKSRDYKTRKVSLTLKPSIVQPPVATEMNIHYPRSAAATELERCAVERSEQRLVGLQLATLDSRRLRTEMAASYFAGDKTWRMTQKGDEGATESEIVWHIQGALAKKDLPPFDTTIRSTTRTKARYLRQGVTIVGFNTPNFLRATERISEIYSIFSRCVKEGSLNPSDIVASSQDGETITASNRYFTSRTDDPHGQACSLGPDIDPKGTLAQLAGDRYFYGEDNVVCYLERRDGTDADVGFQIDDIDPVKIREGDLVEIQVTFMLVPLKGNKWKMNAVLRCITILDTAFALESLRRQSATVSHMSREPRVRLTRKVGKDLEDGPQEEARASKLQRMNVDD